STDIRNAQGGNFDFSLKAKRCSDKVAAVRTPTTAFCQSITAPDASRDDLALPTHEKLAKDNAKAQAAQASQADLGSLKKTIKNLQDLRRRLCEEKREIEKIANVNLASVLNSDPASSPGSQADSFSRTADVLQEAR
ncbi:hypothetical protein, partial [Staphylococcus epidermidis]|uniref:hypothetical protein n=1 Tax=Staphylococcus epidermidis TaxID=1282 RepID=UPI0027391460